MSQSENYKRWYEKKKLTNPEYLKMRAEKHKEYCREYSRAKYKTSQEYRIRCRTLQTKNCWRDGEQHLIENYDKALADDFKGWMLHHRLECTLDGDFAHSANELKRLGMYYNRPYYELIYLTHSEHSKLHYKSGHSLPNKERNKNV